MTALEEIGRVIRAAPGPHATVEEVARWYERKALLLEHIAEDGGPDAHRVLSQAGTAHRRAVALLASRDSVTAGR